jgi:hypothetical protein
MWIVFICFHTFLSQIMCTEENKSSCKHFQSLSKSESKSHQRYPKIWSNSTLYILGLLKYNAEEETSKYPHILRNLKLLTS